MTAAASMRPMARSELASSVTAAEDSMSSRCRASHRSRTCSVGLGLLAKYAMCLYTCVYCAASYISAVRHETVLQHDIYETAQCMRIISLKVVNRRYWVVIRACIYSVVR